MRVSVCGEHAILRKRKEKLVRGSVHPYPDIWRAVSKIAGFAAEFVGCVWTEAVSGKKFKNIRTRVDGT